MLKKWKKVLIVSVSVVALLVAGGICTYEFYVAPKIIEPTLEKVGKVLNDEGIQGTIDEIVREMIESGYLTEEELDEYFKYLKYKSDDESKENAEPGAENLKDTDAEAKDSGKKSTGKKDKNNNTSEKYYGPPVPEGYKVPDKKNAAGDSKPKKKMTLIERARAEMSADEFAFAMSVYGRIDVGYVTANMYTDRAAVKEYVYSRMSKAEVSRALSLYSKYSYILKN